MEYTKLGRTGLDVSRICLGCMLRSRPHSAIDLGVRHAQHRTVSGVEFEPLGRAPLGGLSLRSLPTPVSGCRSVRFGADSSVEDDGFEPSVPLGLSPPVATRFCRQERWKSLFGKTLHLRGTGSSNPSSSSEESVSPVASVAIGAKARLSPEV